jgi:multidrug resistance efflux pump
MNEKRKKFLMVVFIVMITALLGVVFYYWYNNTCYVSTEDARVTGDLVKVSPKVSGILIEFNIEEGDTVVKEQILGRVEPGSTSDKDINQSLIRAPIDGVVVKKIGNVGEYESAGQSLAIIIDPAQLYITANIEETRLGKVKPGQAVDINIDQFSEVEFTGHVKYTGQATNSAFSLLPNSTSGTFTKVVQRVPVRIEIDKNNNMLLPGTNAFVKIHVR